jgi:type I restriction enzyme S subunit
MSLFELELPHGRRWTTIGERFEVTRKRRGLAISDDDDFVFVPMDAIPQNGGYTPRFDTRSGSSLTSGTYFERGDLLVSKITPSFENGKQALVTEAPAPFGFATTEVIPLHPRQPSDDPRLLFFYLLHPEVRDYVAERMEGSTGRQRVPESVLMNVPIPVWEAREQTVISDVLELILRRAEIEGKAAVAAGELKGACMERLFRHGLRAAGQEESEVGDVPRGWVVEPLSVHHTVVSGGTPARGVPEYWDNGTIPWVKTGEVDYCTIEDTGERITEAGLSGSAAKLFPPGTLLLAMYGQGVTRGKVAILGIAASCNQACAAINASDDTVDPKYLYHFLAWRYQEIRQLAHGGQQQNLSLEIVRGIPIAYPTDPEQQSEIASVLDLLDRKAAVHQQTSRTLNELFTSLLHKLATGEIDVSSLAAYAAETETSAA